MESNGALLVLYYGGDLGSTKSVSFVAVPNSGRMSGGGEY